MLFSNERTHKVQLPASDETGNATNIEYLVNYLCQNVMKDPRKELFIMDGGV